MNEIICKKCFAYLFMIGVVCASVYGYQTIAGFEKPSTITATEDPNVQLNRLYEAVKNGGSQPGLGQTENDLLIPVSNGGAQKQDGGGNITPTRQNQRQNTTNGGTHKDYEIGIGYTIRHGGYPIDSIVQDYVQAAYDMGGMDWVYVGQCEQHREPAVKSPREESYGMFQIYGPDHPEIVNDPKFQTDRRWEMQQAYNLYKNGTPFYGPSRISKVTGNPCYVDAQKRFTLANQN